MINKNLNGSRIHLTLFRHLKTIKGISDYWANKICLQVGVNKTVLYKDLSDHKLELLETLLSQLKRSDKLIQRNLDVQVKNSIQKLISLNCYRGRRIKLGLPAHGQRTWSNAKTSKRIRRCS